MTADVRGVAEAPAAQSARGESGSKGVPVFEEVIPERAHQALLQAADACDASFIVVGHQKGGAIPGALLGSVAYALVHRSDRPLALVPPSEGLA